MSVIFKYNDNLISAKDFNKKLKRMKISKQDIEILWEGNYEDLEKTYNKLNNQNKEHEEYKGDNTLLYKIYSNTIPPKFLFSTNDYKKLPKEVMVLTLKGDEFISYKKIAETLN